jgi:preprotein translocase subunit SecD
VAPPKTNVPKPGRTLAVLGALIVVLLVVIVGKDAFSPGKWHTNFAPKLGLDLSSGTTVTLRAVTLNGKAPPAASMTRAVQIIRDRVNGLGVSNASVATQGSQFIVVSVPGLGQKRVVQLVSTTAQMRFRQVLLEAANTPAASPSPTPTGTSSATPSSSPSASPSGSGKASATPTSSGHALGPSGTGSGGQSLDHGAALLSASAVASSPSPSPSASATPSPSATSAAPQGESTQGVDPAVLAKFNKLDCSNPNWKQQVGYNPDIPDPPNSQIVSCSQDGATKYLLDVAKVEGTDISGAAAGLPTGTNTISTQWQVNLTLKSAGAKAWSALTSQMFSQYGNNGNPTSVRDQIAIVLDGVVISAPTVQGAMPNGDVLITGNFTQTQATQLANNLKYGQLPLTFNQSSVNSVSPTLGHDQLVAGLIAGAIGLALVVLYSLLYYRGLAVVSVSSLAIAALLTYEAVLVLSKTINFTLTLAGIAGLIVAIGITADSFVVFFERLRDEVREGNTLRSAVERGWKRARRTILVSDTVSFLAAVFLYEFAITDVKGFAFTLGLTTIIDVVVVFLFTKPMVTLLSRTSFYGGGHPLSGLDPARLGARAPWRASPRPARTGAAATGAPRRSATDILDGPAGPPDSRTRQTGAGPGPSRPRTSPKEA